MVSAPVVITSGSEPVSTADGEGALTSSFSVSTITTNTNVSTPTIVTTTSQVAIKNSLSMMEKSIACLDDTLTRFIEGQKRPSGGTASKQRHRNRSRHKDHYSYYRRHPSRSPQRFNKSSRHYYGYQHGGQTPSPDLSLNASQSETDDEHKECSLYRDYNEEDQQQGDGNHEDVGNLLTQNQQTAVSVPPTMSAFSAESDFISQINSENLIPDKVGPAISSKLAEVAKRYWVEESHNFLVVAKIAERLKMPRNCNFAKVLSSMRKLLITRKSFLTTNGQTKDWQKFRNQ